jgi:prepilin-type N-terminal cleavage/methylation domain-containing protein
MNRRTPRSVQKIGFSLFEMMVTLAVGLVMASIALPFVVGAVQRYRLNSVAQQTANLIDLTRYSAIRLNKIISLQKTTQNGNTILYVDMKGNAVLDANDPMVMLPSDMQIANGLSLTPPSTSMGLGSTIDFASNISFDYRGVVLNYPPGSPVNQAYFLAIGYISQAQYGTRAVTLTPMGQTKTWIAPASGTWTGM